MQNPNVADPRTVRCGPAVRKGQAKASCLPTTGLTPTVWGKFKCRYCPVTLQSVLTTVHKKEAPFIHQEAVFSSCCQLSRAQDLFPHIGVETSVCFSAISFLEWELPGAQICFVSFVSSLFQSPVHLAGSWREFVEELFVL